MARVLLVEDEPNIASIIVFKLEREGTQVLTVLAERGPVVMMREFRDTVAQLVPDTPADRP